MQTKQCFRNTWLLGAAFGLFLALPMAAQKTMVRFEKEPAYPGGTEALIEFMVKNIAYPEAAMKEKAEGMVVVKFVVNEDGSLSNFKTISEQSKNPRADFVMEAVRVAKAMPKWSPAEANGKKMKAEMTLPIKFALE
ncbi:MAG: energy transducer TonB [Saprospiraceae bacterium]